MSSFAASALKILVLLIGLGAVVFQGVLAFPVFANTMARESEVNVLPVPFSILGIALALCIEAALLAVWRLLSMIRNNAIFTMRAFHWVDVIIGAGVAATALVLVIAINAILVALGNDAPGLIVIAAGMVIFGAAFVLLMVVMRGLLRTAVAIQSELAEVV